MDEFWICENCKSLNRIKTSKCYSCKTPRGVRPAPPASASPAPSTSQPGAASSPSGQPAYRPTPLPGPPLPPGAGSQPFAQQAEFARQADLARQAPPQTSFAQQAAFRQSYSAPPTSPPAAAPTPYAGPAPYAVPNPAPTRFGASTVPFSGYPSTAPAPPFGQQPQAAPQSPFGQFGSPPAGPVPPSVAWAPHTVPSKSNTRALSVIAALALVVVIGAAAIIVVAPGLTKSTSFVAAATTSPTPAITASPTPEITPSPSPTPTPTPTPRPSLAAAPAPKGYQQIVSPELDYAISFPSSWVSVSEEDPRPVADQIASLKKTYPSLAALIDSETVTLGEEYRITLFDPAASSARKMMVGLFAVTDAVPPEDLKAGQAALKSELNSLGTVTGLTITSIKEPAGPTLKAVGAMSPSGVAVKMVMYMIAAKSHAFVLVFVTTSSSYSAYAKTYDAIAATVQEPPLP